MRRYLSLWWSRLAQVWLGPGASAAEHGIEPPGPDERWNARLLWVEAPFSSLATGGVLSFHALYAMQLGASNLIVGLLTSGPALVNVLFLIPCGRLVQRASSYRTAMVGGSLVQRLLIMSLALVPFLPADSQSWGVVALVTLASLPNMWWWVAAQAAWSEMFSPRFLARAIGGRWAVAGVSNVIILLLTGKLIDWLPFPANFQTTFGGIGLVCLISVWLLCRFRLPPRTSEDEGAIPPARGLRLHQLARQYRPFVLFQAGVFLAAMAGFAALPLYRIYWVRDLGAAGGWVGGLTAAVGLGSTLGMMVWGRLIGPTGNRWLALCAAGGAMALYPLLTAACSSLLPLIAVCAMAGFFSAGHELLVFNRAVEVSPRARRPTFLSIHTVTLNLAGLTGPLLSTALAGLWGVRTMLGLTACLGAVAAFFIYRFGYRRDEPATKENGAVLADGVGAGSLSAGEADAGG